MSTFSPVVVRDFVQLADAIAELKEFRNLSNECVEELTGLTRGHLSKLLGPRREKSIGKKVLPFLLQALGARLVLEVDADEELRMRSRWERRNKQQVRVHAHPVSITVLRAVKPVIYRELARKAAIARMQKLSRQERARIARRAAKARWNGA